MERTEKQFSVEASVLSQRILGEVIRKAYFSGREDVLCRLYYRSIHDTYIVRYDDREYYFKVYRHGIRTESEILAEVELLLVLKESGVPATEPVKTVDDRYVLRFQAAEGVRFGTLFTAVGVKPSNSIEETDEFNRKLGRYFGSVHKTWDTLDHPVDRRYLDINTFIAQPMDHIRSYCTWFPFDIGFLEAVAEKTKESITALLNHDTPAWGICHGDFYGGNFRLDKDDDPVLFDFDFCGYGWRMYDISVYLNAFGLGWDRAGITKRTRRRESFLHGYSEVMALTDKDFDLLYLFVPFRRIFNIGTIYISMLNTWGDNWVRDNLTDDIETLQTWVRMTGYLS